jgi:hypothetical protein
VGTTHVDETKELAMIRRTLVALVAAIALVLPATTASAASDPTASQYGNDPHEVARVVHSASLNDRVGSLPFTGVDVIALATVALALAGTGIGLRMLSAPRRR